MNEISEVLSMDEIKLSAHTGKNIQERLERRTETAFAKGERLGLMLAAKVRTIALLVILCWQMLDNPNNSLAYVYNLLEIASFGLLGALQYFCAKQRIGMPVLKYVFALVDCALMAFLLSYTSPFQESTLPAAVAMEGGRASFFYIFLMQSAFSLRPQLVLWCGLCIVAARTAMLLWFVSQPDVSTNIDLPQQSIEAFLAARPDPNFIFLGFWTSEVMVTMILAAGFAVVVNRSRRLVESRLLAERTRASLARYFSPNVVDHLSGPKQLIGVVREQEVAVLFADIMGFTKMCENSSPDTVVALLRDYHNRLGQAVFDNNGTLDKYIGDGLMATFGTPEPSPYDARNSLQCALDMITALTQWNAERTAVGEAPVRVGIGLHYGSVIAGDIGNERRLEYSVIGDTVNIASRLEQLTRSLDTPLIVSDSLIKTMTLDGNEDNDILVDNLSEKGVIKIRGRESGVAVWTYSV
ncbi:MAG: adenylate cyclase [bacterium]